MKPRKSSSPSTKPGCKGDPRMNRAVQARLQNPDLPLYHALRIGGFNFPANEDASTLDNDHVTLGQRKNQLLRRLRQFARKQENPPSSTTIRRMPSENSSAGSSQTEQVDQQVFLPGSATQPPQFNAASPQQQIPQLPCTRMSSTTTTQAANRTKKIAGDLEFPEKNDHELSPPGGKRRHYQQPPPMGSLCSMTQQTFEQNRNSGRPPRGEHQQQILFPGSTISNQIILPTEMRISRVNDLGLPPLNPLTTLPQDLTPGLYASLKSASDAQGEGSDRPLFHTGTFSVPGSTLGGSNTSHQTAASPTENFGAGACQQGTVSSTIDIQHFQHHPPTTNASHAIASSNNLPFSASTRTGGGAPRTPLSSTLQQYPELTNTMVDNETKEHIALQVFQQELQTLYCRSMLAAGYAPQDTSQRSPLFRRFAFHAWKQECERLQGIIGDVEVESLFSATTAAGSSATSQHYSSSTSNNLRYG